MNKLVTASSVLSWINLVVWGFVCVCMLMTIPILGMAILIAAFFFSAIPLHSYAALQLHKSIRNTAVPLKRQTITGLRLMGFVALFFGITTLANGITILQNTQKMMEMEKSMMPELAKHFTEKTLRLSGILGLLLGLCVTINVILNFRLLRWYYLSKENMDKDNP